MPNGRSRRLRSTSDATAEIELAHPAWSAKFVPRRTSLELRLVPRWTPLSVMRSASDGRVELPINRRQFARLARLENIGRRRCARRRLHPAGRGRAQLSSCHLRAVIDLDAERSRITKAIEAATKERAHSQAASPTPPLSKRPNPKPSKKPAPTMPKKQPRPSA